MFNYLDQRIAPHRGFKKTIVMGVVIFGCGLLTLMPRTTLAAPLVLTLQPPEPYDTYVDVPITANTNLIRWETWYCIGSLTNCGNPNTNLTSWNGPYFSNNTFTDTIPAGGLRPGRTYDISIYAEGADGTIFSLQTPPVTTWPGYGFTPTNSDAGCDGATSLCRRNISWTTPFPGDSRIVYDPNPPAWSVGSLTIPLSDRLWSLGASIDGQAWAGTQSGSIYHYQNGAWSKQINPDQPTNSRLLSSSDVFSPTDIWFVGYGGITLHTTNGGATWQVILLPSNNSTNLYAVTSAQQNTAWAVGENSTIYFYDGAAWQQKFTSGSGTLYAVTTVDNQVIWAAGSGNRIISSTDGGSTWSTEALPGLSSDSVASITSLDGRSIWAAGSSGKVWRNTPANPTWTQVPSSSTQTLLGLTQVTPDELWFSSGGSVGHIMNGTSAAPTFSYDSQPGIMLGQNIGLVKPAGATRLFVIGNTQQLIYQQLGSVLTNTSAVLNHAVQLNNLAPSQQYFFSTESINNGVASSSFGSFNTPILDSIPPTVTISPLPPATNNCSVTANGTAADTPPGAVQSVRVTLDGNPTTTVTSAGTTNWSAALSCATATPGLHTASAVSNDGTNDSLPATATFVYDNSDPTVTITAPSPVTTPTVTVNGTANDSLDQVAKVEVLVNGVGGRINVPITPGASINWSLSNVALNPGANTIVAYATDRAGNESSAAASVTYNVPTFTMVADNPTSQTVPAGGTAIFPINISGVNGFTGSVTMSASVSPTGLTPLFTPTTVSLASVPSDYTSMIVPTPAGGASGPFTITVIGTSGTITKTIQVTLSLTATPDFTLSANPASRTVVAGNPAVYDMIVSGTSTYADPGSGISWSTSTLPAGVTAVFGAMTGQPDSGGTGTVKLTLTPTVDVPAGTSITVTATDGVITRSVTIGLTATPPPDFTLLITPATAATTAGSNNPGAYNLTVKSINGFAGTVNLVLSPTPADSAIQAVFSQNNFVPSVAGDVVTINVAAGSAVQCLPVSAPCNYNLTITGTSGSGPSLMTKTISATLVVTPDITAPTISGATASASDRDVTISWTTDEPANSRFDLYADAARTIFIGFKEVTTTYCLNGCHSLTYSPILSPLTTYYYTITSADQAYPSGNVSTIMSDANGPLMFTTQAAPDNTPPVVIINSPAPATTVQGALTISGQATDDNAMNQVTLIVTGPVGATSLPNTPINCTSGMTCPFSLSWNTMNGLTPNGSYTLTVTALSSTGPAFSTTAVRTFTVDNDTTPPTLECYPGQTVCEPKATVTCGGGTCTALIQWRTNENSTSEVEYGLSVDCAQQVQRPDGTYISCAYTDAKRYDEDNDNPGGSLPNYTEHLVKLDNLLPNELYHYRVTSCNISNLCTN